MLPLLLFLVLLSGLLQPINGCPTNNIRLVGSSRANQGRVELCINGRWVTVCDDHWTAVEAGVVCKSLGYLETGAVARGMAHFGQGSVPIGMDNVYCTGTESTLAECRHTTSHNCGHYEDAGVTCSRGCSTGEIRLEEGGSENPYEGRVEVCLSGRWVTVCDDQWGAQDARVVCRNMGYPSSGAVARLYAHFGQGVVPIGMDDVQCTGTELTLTQCSHITTHNCVHSEDAGVTCQPECTENEIRFMGSSSPSEGRVEVCIDRRWTTVCDDGWGSKDAQVVCRQLGYPSSGAFVRGTSFFGRGHISMPIGMDEVCCSGQEQSLTDCPHTSNHDCSHYEDAGVVCNAPCRNRDIRLLGSHAPYQGRVEVCVNSAWKTVCDDLWGASDAQVVCRQLGYSSTGALAYSSAYFGEGSVPIGMDNVQCTGTESGLTYCQHSTRHDCGHHEDAGVSCRPECYNGAMRLMGSNLRNQGRVEVCIRRQWTTVCDDHWGTPEARVVCRRLGYSTTGAIARGRATFGRGTKQIGMDDVHCTGREYNLLQCPHRFDHNCNHSEDAGVICRT